jgi:hypothetical protein
MFRCVSKKNLNTYVKFFQFTFNNGINWLEKALKIVLDQCTISGDERALIIYEKFIINDYDMEDFKWKVKKYWLQVGQVLLEQIL